MCHLLEEIASYYANELELTAQQVQEYVNREWDTNYPRTVVKQAMLCSILRRLDDLTNDSEEFTYGAAGKDFRAQLKLAAQQSESLANPALVEIHKFYGLMNPQSESVESGSHR